jgi:shikimate kinase
MALPDAATGAPDLAHVLWIGGAPDAGKTTIAHLLAERHRWQWYPCDAHAHNHLNLIAHADPAQHPAMYAKLGTSIDELWVHPTPAELLQSIVAINHERFPLILADLRAMPTRPLILAEGPSLHPKLVAPVLTSRHQAVWLVPTAEFALASVARRDKLRGSDQSSDPERYRRNVLERNRLFAGYIRREVAARGGALIDVDGTQTVEEVARRVEEHFAPYLGRYHGGPREGMASPGSSERE